MDVHANVYLRKKLEERKPYSLNLTPEQRMEFLNIMDEIDEELSKERKELIEELKKPPESYSGGASFHLR